MPTFFKQLLTAILLCLAANIAEAAEAPTLAYTVVCDDPILAQRLRSGVEERFAKLHIALRERLPAGKLFIYASRDINDTRNKEGVSVAIAHVSNLEAANLALGYVQRHETMPPLLQSMLGEEGMLMHLNVAHMTAPSDAEVNQLLDTVVSTFVKKTINVDTSAIALAHP